MSSGALDPPISRRAAKAALGSDGESMEEQKERERELPEGDESYPEPKPDYDEFLLIGKESPRYGAEVRETWPCR